MKRDSLFYTFFARAPGAIFELLPNPPANADAYRFDAVAVKEAKFEIDGVFLPPEESSGPIIFCEVQMQKVKTLYERLFAEGFLYFYQNRDRFTDWQAIVIYPSRSTEQNDIYPFRNILVSDQMHVVYLDELGNIQDLPLWIGLMVLTIVKDSEAIEDARTLIERAKQERSGDESHVMMELIATVVSYKFEQFSIREIRKMLDMDISVKETRYYRELTQEAIELGLEEGLEKGLKKGLEEGLEEGLEKGRKQGRKQGKEEGRKEGQVSLLLRQLNRLFDGLSDEVSEAVEKLTESDLTALGEAIFDFDEISDLSNWLETKQ